MKNIENKNERRRLIEEELKKVPAGERINLSKDLLEELLFDVDDVYGYKFPTWTGDFLSKIDLSEISFKDVSFDGEAFCETNLAPEEFKFFEFRNTNAVINVNEIQEPGGLAYCDFSGTKVVGKLVNTYKCNFSNCGLTADNFSKDYHGSANNFTKNDLKGLVLTTSMISDGIEVNNAPEFNCFTDTGVYLSKNIIMIIINTLFKEIRSGYYNINDFKNVINCIKGCNIDNYSKSNSSYIYDFFIEFVNRLDDNRLTEEDFNAFCGISNLEDAIATEEGKKGRK